MALIKCPECGHEVSDKAKACPQCGCPIDAILPEKTVKIMFGFAGLNINPQIVTVSSSGETLWEGKTGQTAEIFFDEPKSINIKYHTDLHTFGGECSGTVDPASGLKYGVFAKVGFMCCKLTFRQVDDFDSEENSPIPLAIRKLTPVCSEFRCPRCGSIRVSKIGGISKAASFAAFGVLSANKLVSQYQCQSCGHKF